MDVDVVLRVVHVLAVVHWIGGVAMVTLVLLPQVRRMDPPSARLALFERIEGRFAGQARVSTLIAGLSGFAMLWSGDGWWRLADASQWWVVLMAAVWTAFTLVLFVLEPLVLHRWFHDRATRDPEGSFALVARLHAGLLGLSALAIAGAVAGAHGGI